jgi:chromate transport protein ChrA
LVDEKRWIGHRRFLHGVNYRMLLSGPEAQQLAIYIGWLLNGLRGGLIAGILSVLPGAVSPLVLSALYVGLGDTAAVAAIFLGLAPAVIAIVIQAVRVGRHWQRVRRPNHHHQTRRATDRPPLQDIFGLFCGPPNQEAHVVLSCLG